MNNNLRNSNKATQVTPYSHVGELGYNVPALKHFFRCLELSGTSMYDSKGGCVWDVSVTGKSLAFNHSGSNYSVAPVGLGINDPPIPLAKGNFHTFAGTKPIIALYSARMIEDALITTSTTGATRFAIGDINNLLGYAAPHGLGFSNGNFHCALGWNALLGNNQFRLEATNSAGLPLAGRLIRSNLSHMIPLTGESKSTPAQEAQQVIDYSTGPFSTYNMYPIQNVDNHFHYKDFDMEGTLGTPVKEVRDLLTFLVYDPVGGNSHFICADLDTGGFWTYAWGVVANTLTQPFTPNPCMRTSSIALYGYAVFEFDGGLPTDWQIAIPWMAQEWKRGNKVIWPGWIGL